MWLPLAIIFPQPRITSLSDNSTNATLSDWTIQIRGQLFASGAIVSLNGTPIDASVVNSTTIRAIIPAASTRSAAVYTLRVSNPTPGGGYAEAAFAVANPAPSLTSISPLAVTAGASTLFTLTGTNFVTNSTVLVDGAAIQPTTFAAASVLSSTALTVSVPAGFLATSGSYTMRVINPAPGGGQSGTRSFTVYAAQVATAEFIGVTTAVLAGSADGFAVRFRDSFGNLTDFPATVVNFTNESGSSTGTIALRRTSLGTSSATATTYTIDGNYRLWIEGISTTTGNASFVVNANSDASVEIVGVQERLQAGEMLPPFTVRYFDRFGNPTDRNIGDVTLRYSTAGTVRHTLAITRLSEGVYHTQPYQLTLADRYFVQISGMSHINTRYTASTGTVVLGALPFADVTPTTAVRATLTGVDIDITANQTQTNARVRTYDEYGNLTNVPTITTLNFSNATDATMGIRSSTGTMSLTRTGFGVYDVDGTRLWFAGAYTLTAPELATTTGGRYFQVRSLATATTIVIQPSTTAIAMGDLTANLRVVVQDRYGNPTAANPFPSEIEYNGMTMSSSGTLTLVPMALGTGFAKPGLLTQKGDYTVRINGTALPIFGTTRFRVIGREPERAEILGLPERLCNVEEDIEISIRFTDALGLPTDYYPTLIRYVVRRGGAEVQMGTLEFLGELSPGIARYRLRAPFVAGIYTLRIPSPTIVPEDVTGTLTMEVCSPPVRLVMSAPNLNVGLAETTSCIVAGQPLAGLTVQMVDAEGLPTFGLEHLRAEYQHLSLSSSGTIQLIPGAERGTFIALEPPTILTTAGTYRLTVSTTSNIALTTIGTFCVSPSNLPAVRFILVTQPTSIIAGTTNTGIIVEARDIYDNPTNTIPPFTIFGIIEQTVGNPAYGFDYQLMNIQGRFSLLYTQQQVFAPGNYTIQVNNGTFPISAILGTVSVLRSASSVISLSPSTPSRHYLAGIPLNILFQVKDSEGNLTNNVANSQVRFVFNNIIDGIAVSAPIENTGNVGEFRLQYPVQLNRIVEGGVWSIFLVVPGQELPFRNADGIPVSIAVVRSNATRGTVTALPVLRRNGYQENMRLNFFDLLNTLTTFAFSTNATPSTITVNFEGRSMAGTIVSTGTIQFTPNGNTFFAAPQQFTVAGTYTLSLLNPQTNQTLPLSENTFVVEDRVVPQIRYTTAEPLVNLGGARLNTTNEAVCSTISYQDLTADKRIIITLTTVPTPVSNSEQESILGVFDIDLHPAYPGNAGATITTTAMPLVGLVGSKNIISKQWQITTPNPSGSLQIIVRGKPASVGYVLAQIRYLIPPIGLGIFNIDAYYASQFLPPSYADAARAGIYTNALQTLLSQRVSILGRDCDPIGGASITQALPQHTLSRTEEKGVSSLQNDGNNQAVSTTTTTFKVMTYLLGIIEKNNGKALRLHSQHPVMNLLKDMRLTAKDIQPAFPNFAEQDTMLLVGRTNRRVKVANYSNVFIIEAPSEAVQEQLITRLRRLPAVMYAHKANEKPKFLETRTNDPYIQFNSARPTNLTRDNLSWGWYLEKIQAYKAWDIYKGESGSRVKIGVVDAAFSTTAFPADQYVIHPDLVNRLSKSSPDYHPWLHAQAVAGVIGAEADNCIGSAGVNWFADMVHYEPAQFFNFSPVAIISQDNIVYNFSFAYLENISNRQVFANAYKSNKLMVAGAGNSEAASTTIAFPANIGQGVITVGGTDENDLRKLSFGKSLDISAPSQNILGTIMRTRKYTSETVEGGFITESRDFGGEGAIITDDNYAIMNGTSFAAPQVTGTLSLMHGLALKKGLTLENDDLENVLYLSAEKVGGYSYIPRDIPEANEGTESAGWNVPRGSRSDETWNVQIGYGRLNVYTALQLINGGEFFQGFTTTASYSTTPTRTLTGVQIYGTPGITDGRYDLEEYEVKGAVTFPSGFNNAFIWGRGAGKEQYGLAPAENVPTNGSSGLFGIGGAELLNGTRTGQGAQLHTYIYKAVRQYAPNGVATDVNITFPTAPENARMYYTLFKKPTTLMAFAKDGSSVQSTNTIASRPWNGQAERISSLTLFPPAPNPASSETAIEFSLPNQANVSLKVFDMLGNIVLQPLSALSLTEGEHRLRINIASLPSGSYRVRLDALFATSAEMRMVPLLIIK